MVASLFWVLVNFHDGPEQTVTVSSLFFIQNTEITESTLIMDLPSWRLHIFLPWKSEDINLDMIKNVETDFYCETVKNVIIE